MQTVIGIVRVRVGILLTVVPFGPLDPLGVQEVATVTGTVSWLVSLECLKKVPNPRVQLKVYKPETP